MLTVSGLCRAAELWPDLSQPPKPRGGGEKDAAVIVGAENYFAVDGVPGAKRNAENWQAYLTETVGVPSERVALLRDNDATLEEIRKAANEKAAEVAPGGTLWFIFIGHGAPSKSGMDGLLVGIDAQAKAESLYARSLPRGELLELLSKGKQAKTVVLIDACFSGKSTSGHELVKGLQQLVTVIDRPRVIDNRTVLLTAARSDQFAGALPKSETARPAFSYLALGALRGWASNAEGKVTAGAIIRFADRAIRLAHDRTQTPELAAGLATIVLGEGREAAPDLAAIDRAEAAPTEGPPAMTAPPAEKATDKTIAKSGAPKAHDREVGIEWVTIPGGVPFDMGQYDKIEVTVPTFQMAKTLVTNKQYRACVKAGACKPDGFYGRSNEFTGDNQPVVHVTWEMARIFSEWIGGRLPSEAEWEYAARSAGRNGPFPWAGGDIPSGNQAVFRATHEPDLEATESVCSRPDGNTKQGLCDMAGNAEEWVSDCYHDSLKEAPIDGSSWESRSGKCEYRVVRGGSFKDDWVRIQAFHRERRDSASILTQNDLGFRPARNAPVGQ